MNHTSLYDSFLAESGISSELADSCGLEPVPVEGMIASTAQMDYPGARIPYSDVNGSFTQYERYRFLGKKGKHKYHTPKGHRTRLYYPPNGGPAVQKLNRPTIPVFIVEGEKKAIKLQDELNVQGEHGLVLGLSGIWNYTSTSDLTDRRSLSNELEVIDWAGRDVYICFDNDNEEQSGEHGQKPQVRAAQARLGASLETRGATVRVVLFTLEDNTDKLGADDFLVAGGDLMKALADSSEVEQEIADGGRVSQLVNRMNGRYAFDRSTERVYDMISRRHITAQGFPSVHNQQIKVVKADGTVKQLPATRLWMNSPNRLDIAGLEFNPGSSEVIDSRMFFNVFTGFPDRLTDIEGVDPVTWLMDSDDDTPLSLFKRIMQTLCWGEPDDIKKWFVQRVCWIFQNPGKRSNSAIIIRSDKQGIGKSLFTCGLAQICGPHGKTITDSGMMKDFNASMEGKLVLAFEEVSSGKSMEVRNFVKALITNDRMEINQKYIPSYDVSNYCNVFMTSNEDAPLGITDEHDRRYFVLSVPVRAPSLSAQEFATVAEWLYGKAAPAEIMDACKQVDCSDFMHGAPARATEAKKELVHASQPEYVQWFEEVTDGTTEITDVMKLPDGYLTGAAIASAYNVRQGIRRVNVGTLISGLEKRGAVVNLGKLAGLSNNKITIGGKKYTIHAVSDEAKAFWLAQAHVDTDMIRGELKV